ncbi:MAG: hypoxanthine phosphoribosyltransferase [Cyclobacteriaceae bacterium]|nr:hypoxanthine phosphoribosyltransferase [Cyclobacteriaceae bacterium]MCX7636365.1 hypoxanthine phosphoribosyltransferase [Cyclobacteriaceae bacterium]
MKIHDLEFELFITAAQIHDKVQQLAAQIRQDYQSKTPLFLPILNGSFIFAADLIRAVNIPCRVSFVKHSSYTGTLSTGKLKTLIGLSESLFNQDIIIVEDIMDTGLTLSKVVDELRSLGTRSVEIVTLIRKEKARNHAVQPRYVGFDMDDEFVVGYGLDYEGFGRNLPDIYRKN